MAHNYCSEKKRWRMVHAARCLLCLFLGDIVVGSEWLFRQTPPREDLFGCLFNRFPAPRTPHPSTSTSTPAFLVSVFALFCLFLLCPFSRRGVCVCSTRWRCPTSWRATPTRSARYCAPWRRPELGAPAPRHSCAWCVERGRKGGGLR